ncbi:MAG: hypothetical protein R2851_01755 [Caldilineaceae bacterium]
MRDDNARVEKDHYLASSRSFNSVANGPSPCNVIGTELGQIRELPGGVVSGGINRATTLPRRVITISSPASA